MMPWKLGMDGKPAYHPTDLNMVKEVGQKAPAMSSGVALPSTLLVFGVEVMSGRCLAREYAAMFKALDDLHDADKDLLSWIKSVVWYSEEHLRIEMREVISSFWRQPEAENLALFFQKYCPADITVKSAWDVCKIGRQKEPAL
jgi:hypothetical protein